jgi:multidrug efflux system membrane fusion protein
MSTQHPNEPSSPRVSDQSPVTGAPPGAPEPETRGASRWKMGIIMVICFSAVAAAMWLARQHTASGQKKGPAGRSGAGAPVPVVATTVAEKDVPIYLSGIGTVQAFNTVTIRARVDGQIEKIGFAEGQDVRAGDLLAQIDPAPFRAAVDQATAKKGTDEAQLANARVDLKRYADMLANEGVTQQQYDTQKALVDQLVATVNADQAAIESAKVLLNYTTIVSPIDGRTGIRLVDKGNIVRASDANGIVVITQLKPISVVFILPEQTLPSIRQQTHGRDDDLRVEAVGQGDTNTLGEGTLTVIDNQIDPATRQFKLKATFPNNDLRLWPGQFVNARLLLTTRKNCTVVPASVIQRGPEGAFVFVITDKQTVELRPVKVAPSLPAQVELAEAVIEDGLRPGERVVLEGQFKLQEGSKVKLADGEGKSEARRPKGKGKA